VKKAIDQRMPETPRTYPDKLEIKPLERPPVATVRVPGSKSVTNRALVIAALAGRIESSEFSVLENALRSEDTEVMIGGLRCLGIEVEAQWSDDRLIVPCVRKSQWKKQADIFCGNSGTTMRFLTAMVCLGHGRYRLDGVPRMRERPIGDLLSALDQLGVKAYTEINVGCPPVVVETHGLRGGHVRIRGDKSSQFLSGLLLATPLAEGPRMHVRIEGELVSRPYVDLTINLMRRAGVFVTVEANDHIAVPTGQCYRPDTYPIEPDASAASYFYAAAAICDGTVEVPGLSWWSVQGDIQFVKLLERMGSSVIEGQNNYVVSGGGLAGIDVDMNAISDTVMTLAAVASFADGPTTIRNVAHIRHKETDRLAALATELRRVGAEVEEFADGLTITPRPLHGAEIETYNDHRMAMSMALIGLRVPGIVIKNPGCVAKTYPGFWEDLERLRV
jgi:3-phosphoshikimate 1-carboxyvinyltransferase